MVLFMSITRLVFAVLIFVIFVTSAAFSFQSLTGYLISDQVNEGANLTAFLLFLAGLALSWLFLSKFKNR